MAEKQRGWLTGIAARWLARCSDCGVLLQVEQADSHVQRCEPGLVVRGVQYLPR